MAIKLSVGQEGFFQDWRDRRSQENSDKYVDRSEVDDILDAFDQIDDETFSEIFSEKVLKKFYDCGNLMKYWYTIHYQLQREVKSNIVQVLKKYRSVTAQDLKDDYNRQTGGGSGGKIVGLEKDAINAFDKFESSSIKTKADEYYKLQGETDLTLKAVKMDKSRLKSILELYIKFDDTDHDKKCDGFIFAEDHDEGFWEVNYKLSNLVDRFRSDDGMDAEMEDFFGGFTRAIGACMYCQACYDKFEKDLNWIIKRICVLMKRTGVI